MWLKLSKLLLLPLVLLFCLSSVYSQDLKELGDKQLITELSTILTELETDNQKLTSNLNEAMQELTGLRNNYKTAQQLSITQKQELDELKTSLQKSNADKTKQIILMSLLSGILCGAIGLTVGILQ